MNQNQTESKPESVEDPREEGLDETTCSPFLDINRDGYGRPWHEEYRGYKYAVKVHATRGYCYSVQKVSEDGAMIKTIEEGYGQPSPQDADIAARLRIDLENDKVQGHGGNVAQ